MSFEGLTCCGTLRALRLLILPAPHGAGESGAALPLNVTPKRTPNVKSASLSDTSEINCFSAGTPKRRLTI